VERGEPFECRPYTEGPDRLGHLPDLSTREVNYVSWARLCVDVLDASSAWSDVVGVIGVPRSGLMVANRLALALNVPMGEPDTFRAAGFFHGGARYRDKRALPTEGRVLLLDDSTLSGRALGEAAEKLGGTLPGPFRCGSFEIIPAVFYATNPAMTSRHLRVLPSPRIFAWNWAHCHAAREFLWDFDGVICEDPKTPEDDEHRYVAELAGLRPRWVPTWPIRGIVTHRLERRRALTSVWLAAHGVEPLPPMIMRPEASAAERRAQGDQDGTWKGRVYAADKGARLFVESDLRQAARIHDVSGKPVLCPLADEFLA